MTLSDDCIFTYVLRTSGVVGRLTSGRIERGNEGVLVYDAAGEANAYISGANLRSWCVLRAGVALPEWSHIMPEDEVRLPLAR